MGKRMESRHGAPAIRRVCGQSFHAVRAVGFNLGHTVGFEAGYDKGYAEGSTLGYNNGFLQALDLLPGEEGTAGEPGVETALQLLLKLVEAGMVAITVSGPAGKEAAGLFALLGAKVGGAGENSES